RVRTGSDEERALEDLLSAIAGGAPESATASLLEKLVAGQPQQALEALLARVSGGPATRAALVRVLHDERLADDRVPLELWVALADALVETQPEGTRIGAAVAAKERKAGHP